MNLVVLEGLHEELSDEFVPRSLEFLLKVQDLAKSEHNFVLVLLNQHLNCLVFFQQVDQTDEKVYYFTCRCVTLITKHGQHLNYVVTRQIFGLFVTVVKNLLSQGHLLKPSHILRLQIIDRDLPFSFILNDDYLVICRAYEAQPRIWVFIFSLRIVVIRIRVRVDKDI